VLRWLLLSGLLITSCGSPSEQPATQPAGQTRTPLLQQLAGTEWHCNGLPFRRGRAGRKFDPWLNFRANDRIDYYFWMFDGQSSLPYCVSEVQGRYRVTDPITRSDSLVACQDEERATLEIRQAADGSLEVLNLNEGIEVRCEQGNRWAEMLERNPEALKWLRKLD
jgi:hypothetical protein